MRAQRADGRDPRSVKTPPPGLHTVVGMNQEDQPPGAPLAPPDAEPIPAAISPPPAPPTSRQWQARVLQVLEHIWRDLDGDLSLGALASFAQRSPTDLHKAFRQLTGETTQKYVQRVRLDLAGAALWATDATILDVALAHGFASHEVFTRAFRRAYGESPSGFRRRLRGLANASTAAEQLEWVRRTSPCVGLFQMPITRPVAPLHLPERTMPLNIEEKTLTPQLALTVERTISVSEVQQTLADIFPRVFSYCSATGVPMAGPPFTRYLQMSRGSMTIQAGIAVAAAAEPKDDMALTELPGGEAIVAIHTGPYDTLSETYGELEAWLRSKDKRAADAWEIYLTDPAAVPDPAQWQTQIVMRVANPT